MPARPMALWPGPPAKKNTGSGSFWRASAGMHDHVQVDLRAAAAAAGSSGRCSTPHCASCSRPAQAAGVQRAAAPAAAAPARRRRRARRAATSAARARSRRAAAHARADAGAAPPVFSVGRIEPGKVVEAADELAVDEDHRERRPAASTASAAGACATGSRSCRTRGTCTGTPARVQPLAGLARERIPAPCRRPRRALAAMAASTSAITAAAFVGDAGADRGMHAGFVEDLSGHGGVGASWAGRERSRPLLSCRPCEAGVDLGIMAPRGAGVSGAPHSHEKTVMKLYYSPGACSLSPHIALREAGLKFELVKTALQTHKLADGSDYYAVNPKGQVPLLELDDGERLTEGPAILQYIADHAPGKRPRAGGRHDGALPRDGVAQLHHQRAAQGLLAAVQPEHAGGGQGDLRGEPEGASYAFVDAQARRQGLPDGRRSSASPTPTCSPSPTGRPTWASTSTASRTSRPSRERMKARPAVQDAMKAEGLCK